MTRTKPKSLDPRWLSLTMRWSSALSSGSETEDCQQHWLTTAAKFADCEKFTAIFIQTVVDFADYSDCSESRKVRA